MPALSDPTTWKTAQYWTQGYLFLLKPNVVFSGRVNQASFSYPLAQVAIDSTTGSASNAKLNMLVTFGTAPFKADRGTTRIRKASSSTVLFIGESSQGRGIGEVDLSDDLFFTTWESYSVFSIPPHFDTTVDPAVMYKDYDRLFSEGINTEPVANMGVHMADFIDEDLGYLEVDFDGSASYATEDGATLSSFIWAFGGMTSPNGLTGATIADVQFTPGARWVDLNLFDSNSEVSLGRRLVVACEKTGDNAPIYDFEITSRSLTQDRHKISFNVFEDIDADDYPLGTMVLYWEHEYYNGVRLSLAGPSGREHMKFCGYLTNLQTDISAERDGTVQKATRVEATDFAGMLQQTRGFTQELNNTDSNPTSWFEQRDTNVDRFVFYLLRWHTTVLNVTDFYWSDTGARYPFPRFGAEAKNGYEAVNFLAKAIAHKFTTDMRGRLYILPDPILMDNVSPYSTLQRTSTTIVALGSDWTSARYSEDYPPVGLLDGEGIIADPTNLSSVFCKAPNFVPSQGIGSPTWGSRVVTGQSELNNQTGHLYGRLNAPTGLWDFTIPQAGDAGIEPGLMEWITADLPADVAAQRGLTLTNERFLPHEVIWSYRNNANGAPLVRIRAERETVGQPAATFLVPQDNTLALVDSPGDDIDYTPDTASGFTPLAPGTGTIAAFLTSGIGITHNWTALASAGGPTWTFITISDLQSAGMHASATEIYGATVDAYSPLYISGSGGVHAWFVTNYGVHRITNVFGSYAVSNVHAWANPGAADTHLNYCIHSERGQQNLVAALQHRGAGHTNTGTRVAVTSDGTTWNETLLSSHTQSSNAARPGLAVSAKLANTVYATVLTASGTTAVFSRLYKTSNAGTSWAESTSPVNLNVSRARMTLHIPFNGHTDDSIMYAGRMSYTNQTDFQRYDPTITEINPAGNGPHYMNGVNTDPDNRQLVALAAQNSAAFYTSDDAGDTWTEVFSGLPAARWCHVVQGAVYGGGVSGRLFYMSSFAATPDSKMGNLASLSSAEIHQIIGG